LLASSGFRAPGRQVVDVLDVHRINVLNPDGGLALAVAGKGGLPGPTFEGREYPQSLSGGRTDASGMIFFNERGDEVGGLTFAGRLTEGGHRAGGGLTFAVGMKRGGLPFGAPDKVKTKLLFFTVIPTAASQFYLKLLSGLTQVFRDAKARNALLACKTADEMWETLDDLTAGVLH